MDHVPGRVPRIRLLLVDRPELDRVNRRRRLQGTELFLVQILLVVNRPMSVNFVMPASNFVHGLLSRLRHVP